MICYCCFYVLISSITVKIENSQQIKDDSWFYEVDRSIFTFKHPIRLIKFTDGETKDLIKFLIKQILYAKFVFLRAPSE